MKYLVTDVETGGIGEEVSLLSAYFGILDENLHLIDELELFLKPNDLIYKVYAKEGSGLAVNKINLIEHDKKAITYKEAGTKLFNFIQQHSTSNLNFFSKDLDGNDIITNKSTIEKLEPLGHNVTFDIMRIKKDLISEGSWLKFVSYRVLDTGVIGNYLKKIGKIPKEISGSLSSYCEYFKVDNSNAHDAKSDCMMVVEVFKNMLKL